MEALPQTKLLTLEHQQWRDVLEQENASLLKLWDLLGYLEKSTVDHYMMQNDSESVSNSSSAPCGDLFHLLQRDIH